MQIVHSKKTAPKQLKSTDKLVGYSQEMQRKPTMSEAVALRVLTEAGIAVEQQVVFGFYILDFVVVSKLVVVEIDGGSHSDKALYDWRRDQFVKKYGLKVLRIANSRAQYAAMEVAKLPDAANARERWRTAQNGAIREQTAATESRLTLGSTGRGKKYEKAMYTPKRKQAHNLKAAARKQHLSSSRIDDVDAVAERKRSREARRATSNPARA